MTEQINQNSHNVQQLPANPTSFWNFRHKKVYANWKEKIFDFILGFLGETFLSVLFALSTRIQVGPPEPFGISISSTMLDLIFLSGSIVINVPFLIYFAKRRKFIFYGWVVGVVRIVFVVFMLFLRPYLM